MQPGPAQNVSSRPSQYMCPFPAPGQIGVTFDGDELRRCRALNDADVALPGPSHPPYCQSPWPWDISRFEHLRLRKIGKGGLTVWTKKFVERIPLFTRAKGFLCHQFRKIAAPCVSWLPSNSLHLSLKGWVHPSPVARLFLLIQVTFGYLHNSR